MKKLLFIAAVSADPYQSGRGRYASLVASTFESNPSCPGTDPVSVTDVKMQFPQPQTPPGAHHRQECWEWIEVLMVDQLDGSWWTGPSLRVVPRADVQRTRGLLGAELGSPLHPLPVERPQLSLR